MRVCVIFNHLVHHVKTCFRIAFCTQVLTWPGQLLQLNLVGHDQLGNPTYFIIRLSDSRSNINSGAFTQAGDGNSNTTMVGKIISIYEYGG